MGGVGNVIWGIGHFTYNHYAALRFHFYSRINQVLVRVTSRLCSFYVSVYNMRWHCFKYSMAFTWGEQMLPFLSYSYPYLSLSLTLSTFVHKPLSIFCRHSFELRKVKAMWKCLKSALFLMASRGHCTCQHLKSSWIEYYVKMSLLLSTSYLS